MNSIKIKSGATLLYEASVSNDAGPVDLTGWIIRSQIRTTHGALTGDVGVTALDQITKKGQYRLHADTAGWTPGLKVWDIQYSYADGLGGQTVTYTETINLVVEAAITEGL